MFRRIQPTAKKEQVVFPSNLQKLGLFINGDDQLRQIEHPEEPFNYFYNKKEEKINIKRREAVDECLRRIIAQRFLEHNLKSVHLPLGVDSITEKHVSIYVSDDFETNKDKLLVIVPHTHDNLGIWSVREMEGPGLNKGSMVSTVQLARSHGFSVVILNCGELYWSPEKKSSVTYRTCRALSEEPIDETKNHIPGQKTVQEHVHYVFESVIGPQVPKETPIYILSSGYGALATMQYLSNDYDKWKSQLQTIVVVESAHSQLDFKSKEFKQFIRFRGRAYVVHGEPRGSLVPDNRFGCATFSSRALYGECIVPQIQDLIFDYFKTVEETPETCNPIISDTIMEVMEGLVDNTGIPATHIEADGDEWVVEANDNIWDNWTVKGVEEVDGTQPGAIMSNISKLENESSAEP